MGVDAGRAPLDEVAGHGERSAGEADERDAEGVELPGDEADGLEHVAGVGLGLEGAEPGQVLDRSGRADRPPGPRPCSTSTPKPTAAAGTTMSLKRMAASTP